MRLTGGCLCGAVRFTADDVGDEFGVCHCSMCRRQGSGPQFAVLAAGSVTFEGEESITRNRSSDWGERGFCGRCGANLFFRLTDRDQYVLSLGAFDDQSRWTFAEQIFIDEKPDFYDFANETRRMTGPEFVAAYMGEDDGEAAP